MQCFEGMKAYYGVDGKIRLFRPTLNMQRLQKSSARLALPVCDLISLPFVIFKQSFDEHELLECIKELVVFDKHWVPKNKGESLYLRPTHIGTQVRSGNAVDCVVERDCRRFSELGRPNRPLSLLSTGFRIQLI